MQDSGPQQVKKAISLVEEMVTYLIAKAEVVQINTVGWERQRHRQELM